MDKLIVGCGYLGRVVARLWVGEGHRVFATTRTAGHAEELRGLGLEPVVCDVLDPGSLGALPRAETVLYCVGYDRIAGRPMREVYVTGLGNVLGRLPEPGRFLHVSSTSVYGQDRGEWVDETSATEPQEESGKVFLDAERLLRGRLPAAVVLRFAGIYGPGRLLRRQALAAGEPVVGDGERWVNLIHVEDGAAAVLAAERHARPGGVVNVCDDCPVRRRDLYAEMARVLGAPPPRFVPPPPGTPAPARERGNRRVSNRRLREGLHADLRYPTYREGVSASL